MFRPRSWPILWRRVTWLSFWRRGIAKFLAGTLLFTSNRVLTCVLRKCFPLVVEVSLFWVFNLLDNGYNGADASVENATDVCCCVDGSWVKLRRVSQYRWLKTQRLWRRAADPKIGQTWNYIRPQSFDVQNPCKKQDVSWWEMLGWIENKFISNFPTN